MVDLIDEHKNVESRFYLFVAPGVKSSVSNSEFTAAAANFRETALRLVGAIFCQARFQDWIFAEKVNAQIEAFNAQVRAMLPLFRSRSAANTRRAKALGSAIRDLLPDLFAERPPPRAGEPALETLAAARKRIENQWSVELSQINSANRAGWISVTLACDVS